MLSFPIEDESCQCFSVVIPRAFLEDWLRASIGVDLENAFTSFSPNKIILLIFGILPMRTFPHSLIPRAATCTGTLPNLPRTRRHLRLTSFLNALGQAGENLRHQQNTRPVMNQKSPSLSNIPDTSKHIFTSQETDFGLDTTENASTTQCMCVVKTPVFSQQVNRV